MPDNQSYRLYADIHRPYVVWNVFATQEFSLTPQNHCFPIAGCVNYRGYYSKAAAQEFASELRQQGLDVQIGGVPAFPNSVEFLANDDAGRTYIMHVPGIVGAILLAASRAIGETMIVVLGAGAMAKISGNPFEAMTTITVKIVGQLTGDNDFASPETLVAFALGLTLFVITLALNIFALYIVRKYREQYE